MEPGLLAGAVALLWAFLWAQNNWLVEKKYTLRHVRIASPMRVVHLSDLHASSLEREIGVCCEKCAGKSRISSPLQGIS